MKNSKVLREMEGFVVDDFSTELLGKSHNFLGFITYRVVLYRIVLASSGLLRNLQRAVCRRWHPRAKDVGLDVASGAGFSEEMSFLG